jgi:hypothetical protein
MVRFGVRLWWGEKKKVSRKNETERERLLRE